MKVKNTSTSCNESSASAYMSCATDDVNVDFRFSTYKRDKAEVMGTNEATKEFTAESRTTVDGVEMRRTDRYDIDGVRQTEAPNWDRVFTAAYYAELDAMALGFAADAKGAEEKFNKYFNNQK